MTDESRQGKPILEKRMNCRQQRQGFCWGAEGLEAAQKYCGSQRQVAERRGASETYREKCVQKTEGTENKIGEQEKKQRKPSQWVQADKEETGMAK